MLGATAVILTSLAVLAVAAAVIGVCLAVRSTYRIVYDSRFHGLSNPHTVELRRIAHAMHTGTYQGGWAEGPFVPTQRSKDQR
ncbi:hypothetical protein [Nocardiopsis synnemataformans]|uniref:hypothetical protein n=1 Tax=Nocardiopsis synnemataformans TaxID=61305 RepID=UPI003EB97688